MTSQRVAKKSEKSIESAASRDFGTTELFRRYGCSNGVPRRVGVITGVINEQGGRKELTSVSVVMAHGPPAKKAEPA